MAKFQAAIRAHLPAAQADRLMALAAKPADLEAMPVSDFLNLYRV
jgi:2-methylcitrate dehydratase